MPSLARTLGRPEASFGLAFSAVVIGITFGAGVLGPFGDRLGRKTMMVAAMIVIAIATGGTALSTSIPEFVV